MWREITERGLLLMNFFSDFYQSDWHDKLPLARMVPLPTIDAYDNDTYLRYTIPTIAPLPPGSGGWAHSNKEEIKKLLDEQDFYELMNIAESFFASLKQASQQFHRFLIPNYSGFSKEANSKHAYQFLENVRVILLNNMHEYVKVNAYILGHVYSKEAKQILQLKKSSEGVIEDLHRINDYARLLANRIAITNDELFPRTHTKYTHNDITAHDTRSTMKLLWAAVVVVSFVEAVDRETFFKMTSFDVLEKKHDSQSFATYLKKSSTMFLEFALKMLSILIEVAPDKPEQAGRMKVILNNVHRLLSDKNLKLSIDQIFSRKNDEVGDIPKYYIAIWREITEKGLRLMNVLHDFTQSNYRDKLPLAHMVPRPTTHTIPKPPANSRGYGNLSKEALEELMDEHDFIDLTGIPGFFLRSLRMASEELNGYLIHSYSGFYKEANSKHAYQLLEDVNVILINYVEEYESLYYDGRGHVYSKEAKQILQYKKSSEGVVADLDRINNYAQPFDITAHDIRSTMKLLWAAVVVVSLVEAVDKYTFYKMTHFYELEREPTKANLFRYLQLSSKLYIDEVSQLISIFAEVTPEKPEFFAKQKATLNEISRLMSDKNITKAISEFFPNIDHDDEEVTRWEIDGWRKVTQAGQKLMNKFFKFSHSNYHDFLPLFELVPRPQVHPKNSRERYDLEFSEVKDVYKFMRAAETLLVQVQYTADTFQVYFLRSFPFTRGFGAKQDFFKFLWNYLFTLSEHTEDFTKFLRKRPYNYSKDAKEILRFKAPRRIFPRLKFLVKCVENIHLGMRKISDAYGDDVYIDKILKSN
ncbi:hypothetical protein GE061_017211 [Apolygus lucorum]|uniref:Uncharacterized protein n=1 Tax=Apolygus lucorum TaxID=248454 RepID=A0A8S9XAG6_APOLU|nr:hypothetical protein GE061_017211 [Apolygus lucorum]